MSSHWLCIRQPLVPPCQWAVGTCIFTSASSTSLVMKVVVAMTMIAVVIRHCCVIFEGSIISNNDYDQRLQHVRHVLGINLCAGYRLKPMRTEEEAMCTGSGPACTVLQPLCVQHLHSLRGAVALLVIVLSTCTMCVLFSVDVSISHTERHG